MNRILVELAIATGIGMSEWTTAEAIYTAQEVLERSRGDD